MTGFILAVILTVIPFGVVMTSALSPAVTILVVALFAVAQVFVHLVYFLHLSLAPSQTWNVVSLLFSVLVIVFLIGLSVWIMWSMHYHMMIN
ncbi:cytochrome o ubiquinol oxidase operon protein cyoD [Azomonas macrocytogenes]|uniref:Cytochrome bo(3) ubiquinol oxidase subunit 4 n=2 Tax=Azomonas macrocytogenes TaxID=69962 RepID=A0A839T2H5_AZOMA|nr:cytochrome o ubiquinol oxidase operon protein cyoD [Azomonas macrocytogenes]